MTLKTRLGKLEQPATEKWHRAWERYGITLEPHLRPLLDPLREVCEEGARLGILVTVPECRAALDAFCTRLDIPLWASSWGWDELPEIDFDEPDLTRWPETEAEGPPPEPAGIWERIEPYFESPDTIERWCAVIVRFTLANARGHRQYLETLQRD